MSDPEAPASCTACGSPRTPGAPFCSACGAPLGAITPTPRSTALAGPAPVAGAAIARPAAIGPRVLALLVDQVVIGCVYGLALLAVLAADTAVGLALVPCVVAALAQWIWEARTGRTVGNVVFRVRTVSAASGRPVGAARILLRLAVVGAGTLVGYVGGYVVAASGAWDQGRVRQGWHDKAAGTMVVRSAGGTSAVAAAFVPAEAAVPGPPAPPADLAPTAPTAPRAAVITTVPGFAPLPSVLPIQPPAPASPAPASIAQPPTNLYADLYPTPDLDVEETRLATPAAGGPPPAPVAPRVSLAFDTGATILVTGDGVVGRDPAATPGAAIAHVVPVPDPDRTVSKTHLSFGLAGDGLWVADRGSTNGSAVVGPDGVRTPLVAGERARVVPGSVVEFGDRSFRVEAS